MPGLDRPVKRRAGARIIVLAGAEVLLNEDTDPGLPGSRFWLTPGGGVDEGESLREAAVRELFEETGLEIAPASLEGPIATRRVTHAFSDRILIQDETFFRLHTTRFEPNPTGYTTRERDRVLGVDWHRLDALPPHVWPAQLSQLARWEGAPLDLGEVDEPPLPEG